MIKIKPYEYGDIARMDVNELMGDNFSEGVLIANNWIMYTFFDKSTPVAVFSFIKAADEGSDAYQIFTVMPKKVTLSLMKTLNRVCRIMIDSYKPRLVVTHSPVGHVVLDRWHKFLGFKDDGTCSEKNKTYTRWVRTWE